MKSGKFLKPESEKACDDTTTHSENDIKPKEFLQVVVYKKSQSSLIFGEYEA
jgi:hypothetical protein